MLSGVTLKLMTLILFVCTGNICRSPTAAAVFARQVQDAGLGGQIGIDSAGTGDWHLGQQADRRSRLHADRRGYDLNEHRARQITREEFEHFDLVIAMDRGHQRELEQLAPASQRGKVRLFMDYAGIDGVRDVPDPYYGGADGFEKVLDLIERASAGLLRELAGEGHSPGQPTGNRLASQRVV